LRFMRALLLLELNMFNRDML
jgi:hypothetical protein